MKVALGIAAILIIFLLLIVFSNDEGSNYNIYLIAIVLGIGYYYYLKRRPRVLSNKEVTHAIADFMYHSEGTHINTSVKNIKIVKYSFFIYASFKMF